MPGCYSAIPFVFTLGLLSAWGQSTEPPLPNRSASGALSTRNISLGEPHFANPDLYNLYDQGGSPMGFLETQSHRVSLDVDLLQTSMSGAGDSLQYDHGDYYLPTIRFCQPGIFASSLYFQRESEEYKRRGG